MEWLDKMAFSTQVVWSSVATRLRMRKNGLLKLRNDVRTCEYEDVHVMWAMLKKTETELSESPKRSAGESKKKACWKIAEWAKRAPHICRSF